MRIAWLALALLSALSPAQETTPLVRSSTRLVLLDVVVTDKSGNPVRVLSQKDFVVLEDGKAQTISSFEPPLASGASVLPTSPRTIILLDELNIAFADLSYARERILRFLAENNLEQTPTALMTLNLHGLSVVEDYTQDAQRLKASLMRLRPALLNPVEGESQQSKVQEHAQTSLDSLLEIARASLGSGYNLNVIWVTSGMAGAVKDASKGGEPQQGLRRLAALLMKARIRLFAIDPSGVHRFAVTTVATPGQDGPLSSSNMSANSQTNDDLALLGTAYEATELLNRLTSLTGGHAYYQRNDIDIALSQAVRNAAANYLISYSPSNSDFKGEYRKIEIRTIAEGVTAHTRNGYYAVADEPAPNQEMRELRWSAALASPLSYAAFALSCPSTYDAATGKTGTAIKVRPTPLSMEAEPQSREIVRVAALSSSGSILMKWSWQVEWTKTWTNRVTTVNFDKVLPTKTKRVRFLISDPGSLHIGTCDYSPQ